MSLHLTSLQGINAVPKHSSQFLLILASLSSWEFCLLYIKVNDCNIARAVFISIGVAKDGQQTAWLALYSATPILIDKITLRIEGVQHYRVMIQE